MSDSRKSTRRGEPLEQRLLATVTFCLLAAGAIMVYSASSAAALESGGDSTSYLKRYLLFAALGLLAMAACTRISPAALRRVAPVLLALSFVGLLAVLLPGIGHQAGGAQRWIGVGSFTVQPAELTKLALVLYAAGLLADRPVRRERAGRTLLPLFGVVGIACLLIIVERDLGTALIVSAAVVAMLVAAGATLRQLATIAALVALLALALSVLEPYRVQRLTAFLHPTGDAQGAGFQVLQARIAFGSGGLFGVGLGESVQKIFYLPEAHTDMILAVIGEELGLLGISGVIALFALVGHAGFRIAQGARDRYQMLVAAGLTALILSQAVLNFFGVLGLAPLTGVPLPLISYGGSSLIVTLAALGLLQSLAAGGRRAAAVRPATPRRVPAAVPAGPIGVVEGGQVRLSRRAGMTKAKGRGHEGRDRRRRDGRARGAGTRGRRRAAS